VLFFTSCSAVQLPCFLESWCATALITSTLPHDVSTGQKRFPEHNGRLCEGAFSAEPAAGDHPRGDWGGPGSRWLGPRPTRSCQTWLCSGKWVRLAAGGERVVITRWWEPPPGAGPCADPRGNSPAIWLAGGGQGRAATQFITPQELHKFVAAWALPRCVLRPVLLMYP
jgi:hypothetical protein